MEMCKANRAPGAPPKNGSSSRPLLPGASTPPGAGTMFGGGASDNHEHYFAMMNA
jgi:hypothetical protein